MRSAQHHNGYLTTGKILPILNVLIAGKEDIETCTLPLRQQVAGSQRLPSPFSRTCDDVARKESGNTARCYVVKKNEHRQ